jgi:hypothetical protein
MGKTPGGPARGFCADLFATNQPSRRDDKPNFSTVRTGEIGLLERELPENARHQYFTLQYRPILQIQFYGHFPDGLEFRPEALRLRAEKPSDSITAQGLSSILKAFKHFDGDHVSNLLTCLA